MKKSTDIHTLRKRARGKSVDRCENTWSMCLEASHHEAQKCKTTGAPSTTILSSSALDFTSFTAPPPAAAIVLQKVACSDFAGVLKREASRERIYTVALVLTMKGKAFFHCFLVVLETQVRFLQFLIHDFVTSSFEQIFLFFSILEQSNSGPTIIFGAIV